MGCALPGNATSVLSDLYTCITLLISIEKNGEKELQCAIRFSTLKLCTCVIVNAWFWVYLEVRTDKYDSTRKNHVLIVYCMLQLFVHAHTCTCMCQFENIIDALYADLNVHTVSFAYVCGGRLVTSTVNDVICFQINETLTFLFRKRENKQGKGISTFEIFRRGGTWVEDVAAGDR